MAERKGLTSTQNQPDYDATGISSTVPLDDLETQTPDKSEEENGFDLFSTLAIALQIIFCVLFFLVTQYSTDKKTIEELNNSLIYYFGIVIMMLVGFGYLMTFLFKGGLSAVGFTFIITMLAVQMDIFAEGFFTCLYSGEWAKINMDISALVSGNFAAAACLISFGALIGKCGMHVLAPLMILETIFYSLNKKVILAAIGLEDIGGTVIIHMFGAYFGLSAAYILGKPDEADITNEKSARSSDVFSLIGTVFLWIFWPAFNGFGAPMNSAMQQRVVLNTIISLTSCCTFSFALSKWYHGHKFGVVDIQNATLAGGVMVGIVSNYNLGPGGACAVGMVGAAISVVGYNKVKPEFEKKIHDTCGVHNLHGMPSLAGAALSVILCLAIPKDQYSAADYAFTFPNGESQWWRQLAGAACTLALAIVSGALSMTVCKNLLQADAEKFKDQSYWHEATGYGEAQLEKAA